VRAPVEVPEDIVERVRTLCLALPEVTVRVDYSRIRERSTAWSFDIRRRSFCLVVAREGRAGQPVPLLVLRAGPDEREALLSIGLPFFASRAGRDRIGVLLTDDTDWEEIHELVIESYRVLAPKKLTALLDGSQPPAVSAPSGSITARASSARSNPTGVPEGRLAATRQPPPGTDPALSWPP
jgi:hypothetical protein